MPSFNKVVLMGNLTRDPQLKHLPSNLVVAEFGLACNRKFRTAAGEDKEEVAFVDCTAFGRQAETIGQYCTKGKPLFVEGRRTNDQGAGRAGGGGGGGGREGRRGAGRRGRGGGGQAGGGEGGGGGGRRPVVGVLVLSL